MSKKVLELYLHIPFCIKKCAYCDFLSGPADRSTQAEYVNALCREIQNSGDFSLYRVSSIYIGGGTPSVLPAEGLERILKTVKDRFDLDPDAEVSMEANPGTVTEDQLIRCRNAGINRLSLGCQSAKNQELRMLGRIHTWEAFLESYQMARRAGFDNINMDLMFGLPGQNRESWMETLEKAAELKPEHISAYSLIIEEGTPFASSQLELPDEEEEQGMFEDAFHFLTSRGYHQYEISNYAKPGKECRHNIGYWRRTEYLGLGLGSASLLGNARYSNTDHLEFYLKNSHDPRGIRGLVEKLDKKDQEGEYMILGLRMMQGVSLSEFQTLFGEELWERYGGILNKYRRMGFLEQEGDFLRFTRAGIRVSNPILAEFL